MTLEKRSGLVVYNWGMGKPGANQDMDSWVHYQAALKVARILNQHQFDAYLIGGAVRDLLLGRLPKDFDLVTNAEPEQILKLPELERAIKLDPAQAFGVTRVKVPLDIHGSRSVGEVEVATYRRDVEAHLGRTATKIEFAHLEDDVARRDFSINALALDLANDYLVDYVDGLQDLEAKLVRFIGDPKARVQEDPLRVIRGIRLKNQLRFEYEDSTKSAIAAAADVGVVKTIAVERLATELTRMLIDDHRRLALEDLNQLGVLKPVLPEVAQTQGVAQPPQFHSEGDVWTHTLLALGALTTNPSPRLAWATLLHDIGKPPTFASQDQTGDRIRFDQHYKVGADLARKALARLRFSKKMIDEVAWMVEYHLGIDDLPKMKPGRQRHFMANPAFPDLLELHKADATATWHQLPGGGVDRSIPQFPVLEKLWQGFRESKDQTAPSLKRDLGIDGVWLMKEFKLRAGVELGKILGELNEAYLDEEVKTKEEAKQLVSKLLKDYP